MARFRKMRIDIETAKGILGTEWLFHTTGRLKASLYPGPSSGKGGIYLTGIYRWLDMAANDSVFSRNRIVPELLWPRELSCSVDLADFYWNDKMEPQHPLSGFCIPELVKATKFPFHFPERVRVIPFRRDGRTLKIGVDSPDGVIFVECWSHFDNYDTSQYNEPYAAFNVPRLSGILKRYRFESSELRFGCNLIILPLGFEYALGLEDSKRSCHDSERKKLYSKNAPKWLEILREFFNGEDNGAGTDDISETGTPTTSKNSTVSAISEISATDEAVAEVLADFDDTGDADGAGFADDSGSDADADLAKDPVFAQWLQDGRTKWRDQFWSDLVHNIVMNCEVCLVETDHGVQLYTIADADAKQAEHSERLNRHFETVGEVWCQVEDFTYCQKHYLAFLKRLNQLQSEGSQTGKDIQALHEAFAKIHNANKSK